MIGQGDFDWTAAKAARDEALERVEGGAPEEWLRDAHLKVHEVAYRLDDFTTDDLFEWGLWQPPEPRALGPVMLKAVRDGLIEKTGDYRQSRMPRCHGRPKAVYRRKSG